MFRAISIVSLLSGIIGSGVLVPAIIILYVISICPKAEERIDSFMTDMNTTEAMFILIGSGILGALILILSVSLLPEFVATAICLSYATIGVLGIVSAVIIGAQG